MGHDQSTCRAARWIATSEVAFRLMPTERGPHVVRLDSHTPPPPPLSAAPPYRQPNRPARRLFPPGRGATAVSGVPAKHNDHPGFDGGSIDSLDRGLFSVLLLDRGQSTEHVQHQAVEVTTEICVGKPERSLTPPSQVGISRTVSRACVERLILDPVDLQDEAMSQTGEGDDVPRVRRRAAKMVAVPSKAAQLAPQQPLSDALPLAKRACNTLQTRFESADTHPRTISLASCLSLRPHADTLHEPIRQRRQAAHSGTNGRGASWI